MICPSVANDESLNAKALPGQRYDGTSGTGNRVFLRATVGGDRLSTYRFVVRTRCSDGRRGFGALDQDGEGPARVAADGTFSYATARRSAYRLRNGERVPGRSTFEVQGRFGPRGYSVNGTLRSRFRSRRLSCGSGSVPFRAYLDGSPKVPFSSQRVATGAYSAPPGNLKHFRLRVFLPARQVSVSFRWKQSCRSGWAFRGRESFPSISLTSRRVAVEDSHGVSAGRRGRGTERARLKLRFSKEENYVVYGEFRATIRVRRGAKRVVRCAVGPESFVGVISPGDSPLNLDPSRPLGPP